MKLLPLEELGLKEYKYLYTSTYPYEKRNIPFLPPQNMVMEKTGYFHKWLSAQGWEEYSICLTGVVNDNTCLAKVNNQGFLVELAHSRNQKLTEFLLASGWIIAGENIRVISQESLWGKFSAKNERGFNILKV